MSSPNRAKSYFLSFLLVLAAINLTRTTLEILKSSKRLDNAKEEVSLLQKEKTELSKSIEYKESDEYVEDIARDKLNLVKPGEKVFVLTDPDSKAASKQEGTLALNGDVVLSASTERLTTKKSLGDRITNLKKWANLLF